MPAKCFLAATFLCLLLALPMAAQTTDTIAFLGRVQSSGGAPVADGAYRMSFTLFDAAEGGANLWTETDFNVPVAGGNFVRALGSIEPFPAGLFADNDDLFLEIAIDVDNNTLDAGDIQSPRTPLNSAPVALHAKDAAMLGGLPAQDIATNADVAALESAIADDFTNFGNSIAATQSAQDIAISGKVNAADVALFKEGTAHIFVVPAENPSDSGTNLLDAYLEVKTLTPNGAPLAADNRAVLVVPPGIYDLGTNELTLDTAFVDLVGLTTNRDSQQIIGASNGPGTGVLRQTADNVRIANLRVACTRNAGGLASTSADPAAYFPTMDGAATRITNCEFVSDGANAHSTRVGNVYAGVYTDCTAGRLAFGSGNGGDASGEFLRCSAGNFAFGTFGDASGTFTDCQAGQSSFGALGNASGVFLRCVAGNQSFANNGEATGRFVDCSGGSASFGGFGIASGEFNGCTGGDTSFGGGGGLASGVFVDCTGGSESFGGSGSSLGARLTGCQMTGDSWSGNFRGRMENCRWSSTSFQLGAEARIYGSTLLGNVNLNNTAAGVSQSRVKGTIQNAGSAVFNTANVESTNVN